MNANFAAKLARIEKIHAEIEGMALRHGKAMPCTHPGAPTNEVRIDMPPLLIRISPERFRCNARKSRTMIGESVLERRGWTLLDLWLHGEQRLSVNISDDGEIDVYLFKPGYWMRDFFGVDPAGDFTPILPNLFEDHKNPAWTEFKASGLYQWPPRFPEQPS